MTDRFVLQRDYDAAPDRMFRAWTDVSVLTQWFGCGSDMLWNVHEWDVREGGPLRVSLAFPDSRYEVTGSFVVVDPPNHLRYRWAQDEFVDVRIEARGTGCRLSLEHTWPPTEDDRSMIEAGWSDATRRLGPLLETAPSAPGAIAGTPGAPRATVA